MAPPVVLVQAVADLVVQDLVAVLLEGKAKDLLLLLSNHSEGIADIGSHLEGITLKFLSLFSKYLYLKI